MEKKGFHLEYEASIVRSAEYTGLHDIEEYNAAVFHVYELIRATYTLFINGSFAPSLFLAITVLEEIAKIKSGHMRSWGDGREIVKRGKDPLFSHCTKHKIAFDPIHLIGERISNSIGHARAKEIFEKYASGDYSYLREESLYFSRKKDGLHIPSHKINQRLAAEHILIAIEIFSDDFWGMTTEASEICDMTNVIYSEVEDELNRS